MDKINLLVDTIDQVAMDYYQEFGGSFLEILTKVYQSFVNQTPLGLDNDQEIEKLFNQIYQLDYSYEEIRRSLLLLDIKGYKHANLSIDQITPDSIGIIYAHLLAGFKLKSAVLYDLGSGSGNLSLVIKNYYPHQLTLKAVEISTLLAYYYKEKASMLDLDITIYNQDALLLDYQDGDIIIGDLFGYSYQQPIADLRLSQKGVTYYPYLAIEKALTNGHDQSKYLFLVDGDFLDQPDRIIFHQIIKTIANLVCFIVLPPTFFKEKPKAILVLTKKNNQSTVTKTMDLFMLPDHTNQTTFLKVINDIKKTLEEL